MCYIFTMSGEISRNFLWATLAMLLALSAASAAPQIPAVKVDLLVAVDTAESVNAVSARQSSTHHTHQSSAHAPCATPDCETGSDCPGNMTMSDCEADGMSCVHSGTMVMVHRTGELFVPHGIAVTMHDPINWLPTKHATLIFHPPRYTS